MKAVEITSVLKKNGFVKSLRSNGHTVVAGKTKNGAGDSKGFAAKADAFGNVHVGPIGRFENKVEVVRAYEVALVEAGFDVENFGDHLVVSGRY